MSFSGRVAYVTGEGRGIGRACALARAGADVALLARTEAQVVSAAAEARAPFTAIVISILCRSIGDSELIHEEADLTRRLLDSGLSRA